VAPEAATDLAVARLLSAAAARVSTHARAADRSGAGDVVMRPGWALGRRRCWAGGARCGRWRRGSGRRRQGAAQLKP